MRMRPLTSRWFWSCVFLSFCVFSLDDAEATLSVCAGDDVAPAVVLLGISLLDVWAGLSSFSDGFIKQAHVPVLEQAWVENAPAAVALLTAAYSQAKYCLDFYNYGWTKWTFKYDLIVTAGPSCCPFSVAGKRLRQHDTRSTQGMDTAALAVHLGATVLVVENVCPFLEEDHIHKLVSEMNVFLVQHGYVWVAAWTLTDSALGGCSGRSRVFLVWESVEMASMLTVWPDPPKQVPPSALLHCLDSYGVTSHLSVKGQSEFVQDGIPSEDTLQAQRVGSLWIRGPVQEWMEGEALKLPDDHRVWRIIQLTKHKVRLMFDSRSRPGFRWEWKCDICFSWRHWIEWPVYSIYGVARAIRHTTFAPGDLYLDDRYGEDLVRPLSSKEKWQVMELSPSKAALLDELELPDEKGQLAGNSITGKMAVAVAEVVAERAASYQRMREASSLQSYLLCPPSFELRSKEWSATLLICISLADQSVLAWNGECLPCNVSRADQPTAFKMACSWADQLGLEDASSKCILLERPTGESVTRAIIYYAVELKATAGAELRKIDSVLGSPLGVLAVASLDQVDRMRKEVIVGSSLEKHGWVSGRMGGTAAHQVELGGIASAAEEKEFSALVDQHNNSAQHLKQMLQSSEASGVREWALSLDPLRTDEVPGALRKPLKDIMMAIPEKRSLGLAAKWIGIRFFTSLGLAVITAQKVLRAFTSIDEACAESLNVDQYRSLIGFLEHLRAVLFLRGDKMYGLYDPLNYGLEPMQKVKCNGLMEMQLHSFKQRLSVQAGSSVQDIQTFLSGQPMPKVQYTVATRRWAIFSDAAKEGTDDPGLGGWIHGFVWRVPLSTKDLQLHISLLEAIAAIVNITCMHRLIGSTDHLPQDTCVEAHIDAQATAQVLVKGRAKAPAFAYLHRLALRIPEFVSMLPFLVVLHTFGLANIASDAASRGYVKVLEIVARSVGVKIIHMDEPKLARELIKKCLVWRAKRRHEHCWGDDGIRFGDANHPGPTFNQIKRKPQLSVAELEQQSCTSALQRDKASFCPVHRGSSEIKVDVLPQVGSKVTVVASPCASKRQRPDASNISLHNLASVLWADNSPHAICRGNYEQLLKACDVALDTAANAFSLRTAKQDIGHWNAWSGYCAEMNADPLRPVVDPQTDKAGYLREIVLLVNALVHFMKTRRPRSNADKCIKPQSAMNILLGVNRVLRQNFSSFIPLKALKLPLKGLMRKFIQKFGPTSLVPKRRECMTNGMIRTLSALPSGFDLGPLKRHDPNSLLGKSWRGAVTVAASTGFRKAEMFSSNEETLFLTWDLVSWIINGKGVSDPTDAQLQSLSAQDFAVVTPPPSKADQFNTVWGALPIYLPFKCEGRNAAQALQQLALAVGPAFRSPPARKAVFVDNAKQTLQGPTMSSALYTAMKTVTGSEEAAKLYTWHSFRSYLATALFAAGVKPLTIQAMLRWQTEESLRAYSRLSRHQAAKHLESAANAVVASVQTANVPLYEEFQLFLQMQQMVENMSDG